MNGPHCATGAIEALSRLVASPVGAECELPRRHVESAFAIARWYLSATAVARETFAERMATCFDTVGPDPRLLCILSLALPASGGRDGRNAHSDSRRSDPLGWHMSGSMRALHAVASLLLTATYTGGCVGAPTVERTAQALAGMLRGGNAVKILDPSCGELPVLQSVISAAHATIQFAPAAAAGILEALVWAAPANAWAAHPMQRNAVQRGLTRALAMADAVDVGSAASSMLLAAICQTQSFFGPFGGSRSPWHLGPWAQDSCRVSSGTLA